MMRVWLQAMRVPFLTASVIPACLGAAAAWNAGYSAAPGLLLLTVIGVGCAHAAANLLNDYFDHLSGNDWVNENRSPFSGGSGVIQSQLLSAKRVLAGGVLCLAVAGLCGLILLYICGWPIAILALVGGCSVVFYTAGPIQAAYRGWGELVVGVNFGILIVMGSFFVHARVLSAASVVIALPLTFLIAAVLYINQFPDIEADSKVAKRNLVVRLGAKRALYGFYLLFVLAFAAIGFGVAAGYLPRLSLIALLAIPGALRAANIAHGNYDRPRSIIPACALTIRTHALAGVLMIIGLVVDGLIGIGV